MNLLHEPDRRLLLDILEEMFGPLTCERFIIVGFSADNRSFVVQMSRESEEHPDPVAELLRVISGEVLTDFRL